MNLPKAQVIGDDGLTAVAYVVSAFLGKSTRIVACELNHPDVTLIPATAAELPNVERSPEQLDFTGWTPTDENRFKLPADLDSATRPGGKRGR